ncbi:MAG: LeuD/DmdB family oxidoreductase small subunit [Nitrososphaeria archaeon]
MKIVGVSVKLGDHINTDLIISGKYKYRTQVISELAKFVFEDLDPRLKDRLAAGSIIVAGKNFGCGSSREQAPRVLKAAGVRAILAESFARIFYRNSVNVGLPSVVVDSSFLEEIDEGDMIEVDLTKGRVYDDKTKKYSGVKPYPNFILEIIREGGIVEYYRKNMIFPWEKDI